MKQNNNQQQKGFTMLELVVVIFILLMGLTGVFSLINQSIKVRNTNKHQLAASMLAQEGLELVRNIRDHNWLKGSAWDSSIGVGDYIVYIYGDTIKIDSVPGIDDVNAKMKIDNGFFTHDPGAPTPYSRIVTIEKIGTDDYFLEIICTVAWQDSHKGGQYQASTYLFDWR